MGKAILGCVLFILVACNSAVSSVTAAQETLFLSLSETRLYSFGYSTTTPNRHLIVDDPLNVIKIYQSQSTPSQSGYIYMNPIVPSRRIPAQDYRWEGYWLSAGSSVDYSFQCTDGTVVDYALIDGDDNLASWENNVVGKPRGFASYDPRYSYRNDVESASTYNHQVSTAKYVYFGLENRAESGSTVCNSTVHIDYRAYSTSTMILRGIGSMDVYQTGGNNIVFVAPNVSDVRNIYNGPNDFTVGADMYTLRVEIDSGEGSKGGLDSNQTILVIGLTCSVGGVLFLTLCLVFCLRRARYSQTYQTNLAIQRTIELNNQSNDALKAQMAKATSANSNPLYAQSPRAGVNGQPAPFINFGMGTAMKPAYPPSQPAALAAGHAPVSMATGMPSMGMAAPPPAPVEGGNTTLEGQTNAMPQYGQNQMPPPAYEHPAPSAPPAYGSQ